MKQKLFFALHKLNELTHAIEKVITAILEMILLACYAIMAFFGASIALVDKYPENMLGALITVYFSYGLIIMLEFEGELWTHTK